MLSVLPAAHGPWRHIWSQVTAAVIRVRPDGRYTDPSCFGTIVARIEEVTLHYLSGQIDAGAEAIQLFDSWSGSLARAQFEQWVIAPTARIVAALRERHPQNPIIGFPKGAGGKLGAYARETGVLGDRH